MRLRPTTLCAGRQVWGGAGGKPSSLVWDLEQVISWWCRTVRTGTENGHKTLVTSLVVAAAIVINRLP